MQCRYPDWSRTMIQLNPRKLEKKLDFQKKQRGGLGWNFGNHRARLQYVPTSGPFTPSNQKKFMSKRRRQRQNMTGKMGRLHL